MKWLKWLPRFRHIENQLIELEERSQWPRERIEAWQLTQLNEVWRQATMSVPYYIQLKNERGLPSSFTSWLEFQQQVPVLERDTLRDDQDAFLAKNFEPGVWRLTGGSTGHPMRVYWSNSAHRRNLLTRYQFLKRWNVDFLDRQAMMWGDLAVTYLPESRLRARWEQWYQDLLRSRLRLSSRHLSSTHLNLALERLSRHAPVMLYGLSSAVYLLALQSAATKWSCRSLKLCILTGDPAFPELVQKVQEIFGVPAVIEYSSMDCGILATEYPDRTLRVQEDNFWLETELRADGRYDLIITSWLNPSFPLIRYRIGDVTDAPLTKPTHGFAILNGICGRSIDCLTTRTGRTIHPRPLKEIMDRYESVRRFTIKQGQSQRIEALLEWNPLKSPIPSDELRRDLQELFEGLEVNVQIVDELPTSLNGKHRMTSS